MRPGKPSISNKAVISRGDKSPKAKDRAKKQDMADKNQKNAARHGTSLPMRQPKPRFPVLASREALRVRRGHAQSRLT